MTAIELAEWDLRTFDPSTMSADILTQHRSDINFNAVESDVAASAPTAEASRDGVDYWGDEGTYAVGTLSESGKGFGVILNRSDRSTVVPEFYIDGEVAEWQVGASTRGSQHRDSVLHPFQAVTPSQSASDGAFSDSQGVTETGDVTDESAEKTTYVAPRDGVTTNDASNGGSQTHRQGYFPGDQSSISARREDDVPY